MLLIGKASISMGHLYHGYASHNQRVILNMTTKICVPIIFDPSPCHENFRRGASETLLGSCSVPALAWASSLAFVERSLFGGLKPTIMEMLIIRQYPGKNWDIMGIHN